MEWFVHRLRRLALFDLLELAGKLTVLVAVIFWFLEADNRVKERHYRAWELINAARGSTGDGGRKDALEDLNKDGVSLAAAPLERAWLYGVDLKRAFLPGANLQGAYLADANLQGAYLTDANLQGTILIGANLQGANLQGANLQGAYLHNLQGAVLGNANLVGAYLVGANMQGADLWCANLQGAMLVNANLQGASLEFTKLQGTKLDSANLQGPRHLTQEQLNEAEGDDRTVLPHGLTRPAHWSKVEDVDIDAYWDIDELRPDTACPNARGSDK